MARSTQPLESETWQEDELLARWLKLSELVSGASPQSRRSKEGEDPTTFKNRSGQKNGCSGFLAAHDIKRMPNEIDAAEHEHRAKEESYWTKQVRWQRISAIATIAAFIAAAIYACLARQQVDRMQTANDLTALVLKGTQAAVLEISLNPAWEQGSIMLNCENFGKLAAKRFSGEIEIVRESFPEYRLLQHNKYTFGGAFTTIQPWDPHVGGRPWQNPFPMVSFTSAEQKAIYNTEEIVTARGTVSYDNGLNEVLTLPFCQTFVIVNDPSMNRSGFGECEQTRQ